MAVPFRGGGRGGRDRLCRSGFEDISEKPGSGSGSGSGAKNEERRTKNEQRERRTEVRPTPQSAGRSPRPRARARARARLFRTVSPHEPKDAPSRESGARKCAATVYP